MKKSLLALAVLGAFAGAAQAQSSVTVYGSFDGGLRHQNRSDTDTAGSQGGQWKMSSNGTYLSNRIGFKGVEDLGGGLNAHFTLETGFNTGNGELDNKTNQLFRRTASVGLGSAWGSLDFGRQYSINFQTTGSYDPFNLKYIGVTPVAGLGGLTRLDNDIKYTYTAGPVTVRAEHGFGEVPGAFSTGATNAVGATYAEGPITVGSAYTRGKTAAGLSRKDWTIGGAYTTGPFRVALGYNNYKEDTSATADTTTKDWWLGGSYNLSSAAALTAAYYQTKVSPSTGGDAKQKLFIVGGTYALSKRTNLYADIDSKRFSVSSGTAPTSLTGFSAGINHLF
ncbi:MAG TPA: porin [Noviherbaspirillum sp.]